MPDGPRQRHLNILARGRAEAREREARDESGVPNDLRRSGYQIAAAALRDAADDLPRHWVIPKDADYVRRWLRRRADELEGRVR